LVYRNLSSELENKRRETKMELAERQTRATLISLGLMMGAYNNK